MSRANVVTIEHLEVKKSDIEKVKKILDEAPETKNGYIKVKTVF